jgi:hypothetical protein
LRRKCALFPYVLINLAITLIGRQPALVLRRAGAGREAPHLLELGK